MNGDASKCVAEQVVDDNGTTRRTTANSLAEDGRRGGGDAGQQRKASGEVGVVSHEGRASRGGGGGGIGQLSYTAEVSTRREESFLFSTSGVSLYFGKHFQIVITNWKA